MLKLFLTAAIFSLSTVAHAQIGFEVAKVSFGHGTPISEGIVSDWEIDIQTAFSLGEIAVQLDGNYFSITNPLFTSDEFSSGVHISKGLNNGATVGFFAGYSSTNIPVNGLSNYSFGVEAMKQFGDLRAQAAIGLVHLAGSTGPPGLYTVSFDVDYQISPQFHIGAKNDFLFSQYRSTMHDAEFYVNYDVSNTLAVTAYYKSSISGINDGLAGVSASIEFGSGSRHNLFSPRQYELLSILFR